MSNIFLFIFIGLLPTQLSKFFWPDWSSFAGNRVDFLAPVVYLQDIVLLFLLFLNRKQIYFFAKNRKYIKHIGLGVFFVGVNMLLARSFWVAGFHWITMTKLVFIFWLAINNKNWVERCLYWLIPFWFLLFFVVAIGQTTTGSSLGGILYWLGERKMSYIDNGVAMMSIANEVYMRPYVTFSHPNVLAGFVGVLLLFWKSRKESKNGLLWWLVFWMGVAALFLSASRGALLAFLVCTLRPIFLIFLLPVFVWLWRLDWDGWDGMGLAKRIWLAKSAIKAIADSPVAGVGLGNSILALDPKVTFAGTKWLQPVHNLFLLLWMELGTPIFLGLIWLLRKVTLNRMLFFVLLTSVFDHYWVSAIQTSSVLAVILGLTYDKKDVK